MVVEHAPRPVKKVNLIKSESMYITGATTLGVGKARNNTICPPKTFGSFVEKWMKKGQHKCNVLRLKSPLISNLLLTLVLVLKSDPSGL